MAHWENKHKGSVAKQGDAPFKNQKSPSTGMTATIVVEQLGTQHESTKPSFAAPVSKQATISTKLAVAPTYPVEPSAEDRADDSTKIIQSGSTTRPTDERSAATSELAPSSDRFILSSLPIRSHPYDSTNSTGNRASRPSDRTTSSNGTAGRKRRRTAEGDEPQGDGKGDDDDGDNGEDKDSGENGNHSDHTSPAKLFACPFFKYDPHTYLSCAGGRWPQFHRVKYVQPHLLPRGMKAYLEVKYLG